MKKSLIDKINSMEETSSPSEEMVEQSIEVPEIIGMHVDDTLRFSIGTEFLKESHSNERADSISSLKDSFREQIDSIKKDAIEIYRIIKHSCLDVDRTFETDYKMKCPHCGEVVK